MLRMGLSRVFGDRGNGTLGGLKGFTRPSSNMAADRAPRNVPPPGPPHSPHSLLCGRVLCRLRSQALLLRCGGTAKEIYCHAGILDSAEGGTMPLRRRDALRGAGAAVLSPIVGVPAHAATGPALARVWPGDRGWPGPDAWGQLNTAVGGRLIKVEPLLAGCEGDPDGSACTAVLLDLKNPYYITEQPAGAMQSSGWVDSWLSAPSVYAVAARSTQDVVAAVNFARTHRLRLVIKGGGHSYLGGSNAPGSPLVWMRPMDRITLHDDFVGQSCAGKQAGDRRPVETGALLAPSLSGGDDCRGPLRPRWRMRDRRRCGIGPGQWLRQLLEELRIGWNGAARSRDRHGGWPCARRQCVQRAGPLLGSQGRRQRQLRRRDATHRSRT